MALSASCSAVQVALLAEGVDRNIQSLAHYFLPPFVALLAEGVDRNLFIGANDPSLGKVALLAEGVDRNPKINSSKMVHPTGRPPRGGRG